MKPLVKYILNIKNPWIIAVKSGKKNNWRYLKLKNFFWSAKSITKGLSIKHKFDRQSASVLSIVIGLSQLIFEERTCYRSWTVCFRVKHTVKSSLYVLSKLCTNYKLWVQNLALFSNYFINTLDYFSWLYIRTVTHSNSCLDYLYESY